MGNTSHQPISYSNPPSQTSSFNSPTKSTQHLNIHSNLFSNHFHSNGLRGRPTCRLKMFLKSSDKDTEEEGDGTHLLRIVSLESREEGLVRKQVVACRVEGNSGSNFGVKMWNDYTIDSGDTSFGWRRLCYDGGVLVACFFKIESYIWSILLHLRGYFGLNDRGERGRVSFLFVSVVEKLL